MSEATRVMTDKKESQAQTMERKLNEITTLSTELCTLGDKIEDRLMGTQTPWDAPDKKPDQSPGILQRYRDLASLILDKLRHIQETMENILKETEP